MIDINPQSIADVIAILQSIDASSGPDDGLKYFNNLYLQVTEAVQAKVLANAFVDTPWIARLDVEFAKFYLNALNGPAPECWQVLFNARHNTALARIQFALAGVNAHINHDLPEAIVNTGDLTATHYADYTALNATLDTLIETAKKELHVRLLGDNLPPVTTLEDTIAAWSVSAAREAAWKNAQHLWALRNFPGLENSFEEMLDGFTTVIGKTLLIPV